MVLKGLIYLLLAFFFLGLYLLLRRYKTEEPMGKAESS